MSGYTSTGPFNNGASPGISANFLNNIENWINQVEGDINSVVLSGGSAGTATCYQVLQGTFKYTLITLSGFKTGGSAQQITLPVAYTFGAYIRTTEGEAMSVRSGGTDQTTRTMTGFPSGAGNAGVSVSSTVFNGWSFVHTVSGFNQFNFGASWTATRSGFILIEGV
jgi:hypothetical protein